MDDLARDLGAIVFHFRMLRRYLDDDRQQATKEPGVFYVDNHLRPYTGKHVVRKGWRMQDRRVRPGVSDYYVHDADGRPLFRIDVPSHDSLPMWMMPAGYTELAGRLMKPDGQRKLLLDTVRIACANAESDLAQMLARTMTKPREAKKLLSNVLRAPAKVRVGTTSISVELAPAATAAESESIAEFLSEVSRLGLRLPGDPRRRKLRFKAQLR